MSFKKLLIVVISFIFIIPSIAFSQPLPVQIFEQGVAELRAVNFIVEVDELQSIESKTITFFVPADEIENYKYYVASVRESGSGWSSVVPDEFGVIYHQVDIHLAVEEFGVGDNTFEVIIQELEERVEHYYLFALEIDTGDIFYTFDLPQLNLISLIYENLDLGRQFILLITYRGVESNESKS